MSEPESILDAKIMNLLQVVEQHRDRQCAGQSCLHQQWFGDDPDRQRE